MNGTIKHEEGKVVLEGFDISLIVKGGSYRLVKWYGSSRTMRPYDISLGVYRLELADGRDSDS